MPVDKFGRMSDTKTKDTGVSLTYINNNYIRSDGGTLITGSIDMNGNTLHNVADPVNPQDVATKEYTDNKRTHIIAINSHYTGPLHKDTFQYSFGGETDSSGGKLANENPGFLVPHSGRIVKLKMKTPISSWALDDYFTKTRKRDLSGFDTGIFKVYNFKNDGSYLPEEIGAFTCKNVFDVYDKETLTFLANEFCFDEDLPIFKPEVMEGDIINVATMIDLDLPAERRGFILTDEIAHRAPFFKSEYKKKWVYPIYLMYFYSPF